MSMMNDNIGNAPLGFQKEIDVNIQSQTSQLFRYFLMLEQKTDITLTSVITMDDEVVNVSGGHGFTAAAGEYIVIRNGDLFTQTKVIAVNSNAITVEMPIASDYPVTSTVIRGNINMNIDGDAVPTDFKFTFPGAQIPIDLSTIILTMQHGTNVPDDGKFGGLTALPKGIYFRQINGGRVNLGNYTNNQAFKDVGAVVEYTTKAPAGTNGTNVTVEIEDIFGQVIRLNPRDGDEFIGHVRDDINAGTGMAKMTVAIIGSFTSGE